MLIEKRLQMILDIVNKRGSATVLDLTKQTSSSESTIRRDLNLLSNEGKIIKVHGGAIALKLNTKDEKVGIRREQNSREKEEIAIFAASLIEDDDFVYLDSGSTIELMIDNIKAVNATFVTNSIFNIKGLTKNHLKAFLLGGEYKESTDAIVGEKALNELSKYNFTKGFFGTNGISKDRGFTTPEIKEAMIKELAIKNTRECFILSDVSKFGKISAIKFADFDRVKVITNKDKNNEYLKYKNVMEANNDLYRNS